MKQNNIIHVHLDEPYQGKRDWYFGSVAAIYDKIPREVIGAGKEWLWQCLSKKNEHNTRKARIRRDRIITKQQKR